jgi:hypothetical protein
MEFVCLSRQWRMHPRDATPEVIIRALMEALVRNLPGQALGHAKLYAEYEAGAVFASSVVVPPDVTVQKTGTYLGGEISASITLVFADVPLQRLSDALAEAETEVQAHALCALVEVSG